MRYQDQLLKLNLIPSRLFGAEGEDDGEGETDPQVGDEGSNDATDDDAKTFDQAYVDSIRKEAADRRVKAKDAEARATAAEKELAKLKKSEMDDLERLQVEADERQAELEAARQLAEASQTELLSERIRNTVYVEAVEQGFQDPSDALSMISQDDIVDDGEVSASNVKKQLKSLATKKPYLLKSTGPGSGDGGGRGKTPEDDGSFDSKVEKYKNEMKDSGRILR